MRSALIFIKSKKIALPEPGIIGLSYAGMLPAPGELVYGGRVKLMHLGEVFPEQRSEFNILYLVSSALPSNTEEWVKACKKAGVKIVWNQNGVGYPAWAGDNYEAVNAPMRELIHKADQVIFQSEFCKIGADRYLGEFKGPQSIIYNCVDTSVFTPRKTVLPVSPIKLLIMGSHHQSHRVTTALDTLAILLEHDIPARLQIAGRLEWDGAGKEIRDMINSLELSDHVIISGPYLQDEAPSLYHEAHILLHFKYNDPCPTVPIEAMACGIPIIGSISGGVPELLGKTGGIMIEVPQGWEKDHAPAPEAAADAVVDIMRDWPYWSRQARLRAEFFDKYKWLKEHKKLFYNILSG